MLLTASACVPGRSHQRAGLPCQDRADGRANPDGSLASIVLCDGAGSCLHSDLGAQLLTDWFPLWLEQAPPEFWGWSASELATHISAEIGQHLQALASERKCPVGDLSSTFLAAAVRRLPDALEFRLIHLGDGIAAAIGADARVVISAPDNGEFANETVFTTSSRVGESLRVISGHLPLGSGFVLMSDGTGASLYLKARQALAPGVPEMLSWLNDHDSATVSEALIQNLRDLLCAKTTDDCSLALLLDRDPTRRFTVEFAHPQPPKSMPQTHPIKSPRKLIEVALPLDAINEACAREKSIRHGHPSTLHLWWARRPLAAARAVIFAQLVNDPGYQQGGGFKYGMNKTEAAIERKRLFKIIEDLVLWENTTNEEVLERARAEIRRSWREVCELNKDHPQATELFNPEKLAALHDPFAGGGAIPLEAQRLGLEAYASDLNPVAVLINKAMIEIPPKFAGRPPVSLTRRHEDRKGDQDKKNFLSGFVPSSEKPSWPGATGLAEDVRHYGTWMREEAQKRIGHLYPPVEITAEMAKERPDLKPLVGQKLTVIAWLWARTVKSPNPAFSHVDVPLVSSFILSPMLGKEAYIEPIITDNYRFTVKVDKVKDIDAAGRGTKLARGANFRCLMSNTPMSNDYVRGEFQARRNGERLMAIVAEGQRGRVYLSPDTRQESLAKGAQPAWRPEQGMNQDSSNLVSGRGYGIKHWHEIFSSRQLVALTTFSDLIGEARELAKRDALAAWHDDGSPLADGGAGATAYADAIAVYLAFLLSKLADKGSTLCTWDAGPASNRTTSGRSARVATVRVTFGRQALPMTWDFAEVNFFSDSVGSIDTVLKTLVAPLTNLPLSTRSGSAHQAEAQNQSSSAAKVISTDPPYYDNIAYADLSDFFYVWLRPTLKTVFPELFTTLVVPKAEELVATPYRHGGKDQAEKFFLKGMTQAMHRLAEQSHPAFPTTVYYAFKQSETDGAEGTTSTGWETFLNAVFRAGFALTGTWPMRTEMGNRQVATGTNALASSIVLVCRKRPTDAPSISRREFIRELNGVLPEALDEMTKGSGDDRSPVAPVDLSQAIIGPGMAVFSKYAAVLEADGSPMSVRTALQLINRFLAEDDFDADTQFCLHWFEQHGWNEGAFGTADTLARGKGTSVDGVKEAGVIQSGGGKVRLLKWAEYPTDWNPRTDTRMPVWEALHHLIRALRQGGDSASGALLAALGGKADAVRQLAYRLYTLCERLGQAEDARAYNELITSWTGIESAATAAPKPLDQNLPGFES